MRAPSDRVAGRSGRGLGEMFRTVAVSYSAPLATQIWGPMPPRSSRSHSGARLPIITACLLALLCAGTGCVLGTEYCTADYRYGLTVVVRDSVTSALAIDSTVVTAQDGAYVEVLAVSFDSLAFIGAGERPGRYAISVARLGYLPWLREGVKVSKDGCHVQPTTVEVRLQR